MEIKKDLPFDICETCSECVLDVNEQVLFSYGEHCQRVITVGCRNAKLCMKLKEKHDAENGGEVHHTEGEGIPDRGSV